MEILANARSWQKLHIIGIQGFDFRRRNRNGGRQDGRLPRYQGQCFGYQTIPYPFARSRPAARLNIPSSAAWGRLTAYYPRPKQWPGPRSSSRRWHTRLTGWRLVGRTSSQPAEGLRRRLPDTGAPGALAAISSWAASNQPVNTAVSSASGAVNPYRRCQVSYRYNHNAASLFRFQNGPDPFPKLHCGAFITWNVYQARRWRIGPLYHSQAVSTGFLFGLETQGIKPVYSGGSDCIPLAASRRPGGVRQWRRQSAAPALPTWASPGVWALGGCAVR